MNIFEIIIYIICGILILAGCIVTLISLPGYWLIFLGYLISGIVDGFDTFSIVIIVFVFLICLASTLIDNAGVLLGAKKFGASKWGMFGAFVGSIVGFLVGSLLGLILGPLIGAFLFEILFSHKEWKSALKAGFGTFLGLVLSIITKFVINVGLAFLWLVLVL